MSPTESISSTISISGSTTVAIEKASLAIMPEEKFCIGTSKNSESSLNETISSNLELINSFE